MSYEKQTWANGDVITAEKLNHIEEGIAEGGDAGYECEETEIVYFDGSVVVTTQDMGGGYTSTEGSFTPELAIPTRDTLEIKLNGDQLELSKSYSSESVTAYSIYIPSYVSISVFADHATLMMVEEGTYSLSIKDVSRSATYTECFKTAVTDVCKPLIPKERYVYIGIDGSDFSGYYSSISPSKIYEMATSGKGNRLIALPSTDGSIECRYVGYNYNKQAVDFMGWTFNFWRDDMDDTTDTSVRQIQAIIYRIPVNGEITRKVVTVLETQPPTSN